MGKMKIAPAVKPNHESKQGGEKTRCSRCLRTEGIGSGGVGGEVESVRTCVCVGSVQQRVLGLVAQLHLLLQGLLESPLTPLLLLQALLDED